MNQLRTIEPSQTLLINQLSKKLQQENKNIYRFGFGESPFMPPDFVVNAFRDAVARKEYTNVQGDLVLRQAIASFHKAAFGITCSEENIFVAPGSKILLFAIMASFLRADVLIPVPAWVSYAPQARLAGHHCIAVETNFEQRWRLTPDNLRLALTKKIHSTSILVINYPGNPEGLSYTQDEVEALAEVAREHDMLVISDEIYALLTYDKKHYSFSLAYENTITTSGLSKWCGAGGWRLGVAMLPDSLAGAFKESMIGVASETYSCAPSPVQEAARIAYEDFKRIQPYIQSQVEILRQVGAYCHASLSQTEIRLHPPEGAFYMLPDFSLYAEQLKVRGITTSVSLCNQLLSDTGVVLLPGTAFGFPPETLTARLAYVDFADPTSKGDFDLKRNCPRVVEGIDRLVDWLNTV